ncbi:GvpL/GvpF family gas vesicle protein [Streptomyces sp. NPDC047097]|uniref:GvpL/GvpF family gas vesicle protein n=1 Tax=Streptomyces sp. NPDC047097 TaxID=3155260 RepID=UPI0033DA3B6C
MSTELVYVYGVAAGPGLAQTVPTLQGVGGARVRLIEDGGLAAVVGPVAAADFEEAALAARLEDLRWLEAVARAHHAVVDAVAVAGPVLPLRLATVYRDEDGVRALLADGRDLFASRLARLAGHVEWGVKVHLVPPPAPPPSAPAPDPSARPAPVAHASGPEAPMPGRRPSPTDGAGTVGPGRAYLRTRGHERRSREDAHRAASAAVERVRRTAAAHAAERVNHRVQQGPLAEGRSENLANDAYLVPSERCAAFLTEVRRAAEQEPAVRVEVTGPWAPYSFAGLDGSGAAAGP